MENLHLSIDGMTCMGCVKSVEKALRAQEGVTNVNVQLDAAVADITYQADKVTPETLISVIEDAGFDATRT